ncbi:MAG: hypothetical protein AMJ59_07185 [Gammaproteobacteria bacterium SG8_31]|nr:MAG: hypothetical protein AMJ59_07185 [Gammaproteobacteria bacterium SG8_31]
MALCFAGFQDLKQGEIGRRTCFAKGQMRGFGRSAEWTVQDFGHRHLMFLKSATDLLRFMLSLVGELSFVSA